METRMGTAFSVRVTSIYDCRKKKTITENVILVERPFFVTNSDLAVPEENLFIFSSFYLSLVTKIYQFLEKIRLPFSSFVAAVKKK